MGDRGMDKAGGDGHREDLVLSESSEREALDRVLSHLFEATDVDFSRYRQTTVMRRIARRISMAKLGRIGEYLEFIERHPEETRLLYEDLLLSYTEFFRNAEVFEALQERVFPALVEQHRGPGPVRIWVPGCSTGQEAYSLAMAYHEFATTRQCSVRAQVFGTDLNPRHIVSSREAVYPDKVLGGLSPQRLETYFERLEKGVKVRRNIREMCVFAVQNLIQDPPLSNMNLVSCRNVLIYFDGSLQEIVLPIFHFSLCRGGYLLLGSAESVARFSDDYDIVDSRLNLFSRRSTPSRLPPAFSGAMSPPSRGRPSTFGSQTTQIKLSPEDMDKHFDDLILSTFAPACLLVDSGFVIRHMRGPVFDFLEPAPGQASLRLSKMAGEGLMPVLYVAIEEARRTGKRALRKDIIVHRGESFRRLKLSVTPTQEPGTGEPLFLVAFECIAELEDSDREELSGSGVKDSELDELRRELSKTKEYLQAIIEEKDQVNQELWAANEEVQSSNEELQSINEEMEAAKEELESSNEELLALNEQLVRKNVEVTCAKEYAESLIETAKAVVVTLDDQGRITAFNRFGEELTGYARAEVLGQRWFDQFIPVSDRPDVSRVFAEVLARMPERSQHENTILRRDGSRRLLSWSNTVLREVDGGIRGVLSVGIDVTEQREAATALQVSEDKYRTLFNAMRDGFALHEIILDELGSPVDYRFLTVNPSFEHLTGLRAADIVGRTAREVLPGLEEGWIDTYAQVALTGQAHIFESYSADLDRHFSVSAFQPAPGQFACAFTDITERKASEQLRLQFQEKEQQAQRLESLGVLAGGIAHDFNNLLGGIFGFIELAGEESNEPGVRHCLERASSTIERARGLTRQLLTFAKGGAPVRKVGALAPLVRETVRFALSGSAISCRFRLENDLWPCSFDGTQIAQVIENIVINAQQAMPLGGGLEVVGQNLTIGEPALPPLMPGRYVKLTFKDQGVGIPQNMIERIFDPFFTTKAKGHGLGLATSYSIVQRHGGTMEVESELGQGSSFHVILPAAGGEPAPDLRPEPPTHAGQGLFIIMDDEEVVRDLLEQMIRSVGYETQSAPDGEGALALVRRALDEGVPIAGMIFDLTIPGGKGGKQIIGDVRELMPDVPVFVTSGYFSDPVMASPVEHGFTASLSKPFRRAELCELLDAHLPEGDGQTQTGEPQRGQKE